MGTDIHVTAQKKIDGLWIDVPGHGFDTSRNYAAFGWLADVRNYHGIPPLAEQRGLPDDTILDDGEFHDGYHSVTWFLVDELAGFDFDQPVEDRRYTATLPNGITHGGLTAPGGYGTPTTYRALLGPWFVDGIAALKASGAERVIISFDS